MPQAVIALGAGVYSAFRSSSRMASRALITSSLDAFFLANVSRRLNALVGGRKLKT